jgi:translin
MSTTHCSPSTSLNAITGGLRRTLDALRAVLERTRGDVTTTVQQTRLRDAIERAVPTN